MTEYSFKKSRHLVVLVVAATMLLASCGGTDPGDSRQRNAALPVADRQVLAKTATAIASGSFHTLVLDSDGNIAGWGSNMFKQLDIPRLRDNASRFTAVAAGMVHSLALDDLGQMYAWGKNDTGESTIPRLRGGATRFVSIAGGAFTSLAIDDLGQIYAWGGIGGWNSQQSPSLRGGASKFTAVAGGSGGFHSLALDDLGQIYMWRVGSDDPGTVGSVDLGTVPELADGATRFTAIAAGRRHSHALDDTGRMYAWGILNDNAATTPPLDKSATRFTAISSGVDHAVALDDTGRFYGWGSSRSNETAQPPSLPAGTTLKSVVGGHQYTVALGDTGSVHAWGWNIVGQTNVSPLFRATTARSQPIAMGGVNAFAVADTGEVTSFTRLLGGIDESSYVSVAAGPRHALAITRSGTVTGWGDFEVGQLDIPADLSNVVQVAAGYAYSAALRSNGTVAEWGSHASPAGQLIPMPNSLPLIRHIEGGLTHLLAITADGKVVGWGSNEHDKATPPAGLNKVIDVAANDRCSVALRSNGELVYWGSCSEELTAKRSATGATAVALSNYSATTIENGSLVTWGENWDETLAPPSGSNFVAVSGGTAAFLAVTSEGMVSAWGTNHYETITIPQSFGGAPPIVNDQICQDCPDPEPLVWTDEMIQNDAAAYTAIMSDDERNRFIEALGGSIDKPMTPDEIQALINAASVKARAAALAEVNTAAQAAAQPTTAAVLPASKSPLTTIGTKVSTRKAVAMLGLKKVTRVSFVRPKTAIRACTVTTRSVTAKQTGTCTVTVRYTDAKKKARTTTLTLTIG